MAQGNVSRETSVLMARAVRPGDESGANEDHGEETADGQRGVRPCGAGGGRARGGGISRHAVVRGHRDDCEATRRRHRARRACGMVDEREGRAGAFGRRSVCRRALPVHVQTGGTERGERRAHEPELRGREGRARAVRGRRPRPHLVADRAGHAPVRGVREGAGAGSLHARRGVRHDEGRVRSVRTLRHARHRASDDAHLPRLDVLRGGRRH